MDGDMIDISIKVKEMKFDLKLDTYLFRIDIMKTSDIIAIIPKHVFTETYDKLKGISTEKMSR